MIKYVLGFIDFEQNFVSEIINHIKDIIFNKLEQYLKKWKIIDKYSLISSSLMFNSYSINDL